MSCALIDLAWSCDRSQRSAREDGGGGRVRNSAVAYLARGPIVTEERVELIGHEQGWHDRRAIQLPAEEITSQGLQKFEDYHRYERAEKTE